jgi:hypothetical protein
LVPVFDGEQSYTTDLTGLSSALFVAFASLTQCNGNGLLLRLGRLPWEKWQFVMAPRAGVGIAVIAQH